MIAYHNNTQLGKTVIVFDSRVFQKWKVGNELQVSLKGNEIQLSHYQSNKYVQ